MGADDEVVDDGDVMVWSFAPASVTNGQKQDLGS